MKYIVMLGVLFLVSCNQTDDQKLASIDTVGLTVANVDLSPKDGTNRWYTYAQLEDGKGIFDQYCASCHGKEARSIELWKKPDANGNYPPPPLDGSAHAWHHPLEILDMVIRDGGEPLGGVMPAWKDILTEEQRLKTIASFQFYWSDETYAMWLEREKSNRNK